MENHVEKALLTQLQQAEIPYALQESLARHTTFAIGGAAKYFLSPQNEQQLIFILRLLHEISVPYTILGRGSNVLFSDTGFDGVVISTLGMRSVEVPYAQSHTTPRIIAECGVSLRELALLAAEHGWQGLEFAHGIPGTLGGAVRMNAGAYGGSVGTLVKQARLYCAKTEQIRSVSGDEMAFSYRHSILTDNSDLVCLSATLELPQVETDARSLQQRQTAIRAVMEEMRQCRRNTQPLNYPSAGSVFKRPQGYFAGKLIEDCQLKGACIGGAQVSEKHAGFIVNRGDATAEDVCRLINLIKQTVKSKCGVVLEEEIVFIEQQS